MTPLKDGQLKTACQQSCPADAIHFGNLNDPESAVHKLVMGPRAYHSLEEVKTLPNVVYLTKIRNKEAMPGAETAPVQNHEAHHS